MLIIMRFFYFSIRRLTQTSTCCTLCICVIKSTTITAAEAKKNFADIVNKVAYGKEPIVVIRKGQEIAALVSIDELKLLGQIEDHIDIKDAKKALAEPSDNISVEDVRRQLGL